MAAENMNKELFEQALGGDKPVLVNFSSPLCIFCRKIDRAYDMIAEEYADTLIVGKVNIDKEPEISKSEKIEVVPTLVLYKEGKAVDSIVAPESKKMIENFIQEGLEKDPEEEAITVEYSEDFQGEEMPVKNSRLRRALLFTLGGALVGLAYYFIVGCKTGTCVITANPFTSMAYMGLVGLFLSGSLCGGCGSSCNM